MLRTQKIPSDFSIQIGKDSLSLPAETEKQVSAIWEAEKMKRGGQLFNGQMLSVVHLDNGTLHARIVDYRTYLAQMRAPHLYGVLKIRSLAVSGLVTFGTRVVFGKRAAHLTQDAGKWELAPSGGLTPAADGGPNGAPVLERQFFNELEEELGVTRSLVTSVRPFILVEDLDTHVMDIGIDATLGGSQSEVDAALGQRSDEYSEIRWIEISEIPQFCSAAHGHGALVEVSTEMLRAKGILQGQFG